MMPKFSGGIVEHRTRTTPGTPTRYLRIKSGPLRDQYVHVLVMEAKLGRKLTEDETVEHIDGNGLNPDPDNLIVVTRERNSQLLHERQSRVRSSRARAAADWSMHGADCGDDTDFCFGVAAN
jgi:hypothetical protein